MQITVDTNKTIERLLRDLRRFGVRGASYARTAYNRTASTGRTRIVRRIGEEIATPQKNIRGLISIKKATSTSMSSVIRFKRSDENRGIPLSQFRTRPKDPTYPPPPRGMSVKVRKKKSPEKYPSGFQMRVKGRVGMFVRFGQGEDDIEFKFGPTPLGVFLGLPGLERKELTSLHDVLVKELNSRIKLAMMKEL